MRNKVFNHKFSLLLIVAGVFVLTGVGCRGGDREAQEKAVPLTLTYWTVEADVGALQAAVNEYKTLHPNVHVEITQVAAENYDLALLEAWAEDRGPDIFSIHNTWVGDYQSKIAPMPASTNLPVQIITGTLKKEPTWILNSRALINAAQFASTFVPQVAEDAVVNGQIYGVPLNFDTLALYFNRDIFNNFNVISAPQTWIPFTDTVKSLTLLDSSDQIIQSAVGIGRDDNVNHSVDMVSLLMMQNGVQMLGADGRTVIFNQLPPNTAANTAHPTNQALLFYTDFSNFGKEVYTWNETMPNSIDAFAQGLSAMYFGYARDRAYIETNGPGINYEISSFPQIDGSIVKSNFANYWLETVSRKGPHQEWAWDFLTFITDGNRSSTYTTAAKLPTAHRAQLETQSQQIPDLTAFNLQALTAKSWYHGRDAEVAYELFGEMIQGINDGARSQINQLILEAVSKINQTL